ncbi:hypothetical protein L3X38_025643 [Prunus dulcis]|uniref:Uncharacterized protein n=1 Tax=Prunus dulcis TaxID=3755 RepID=A0AAD4W234_PRUDU|nr:hypothetical protein L3X38_025643 [Prunus dulcis]
MALFATNLTFNCGRGPVRRGIRIVKIAIDYGVTLLAADLTLKNNTTTKLRRTLKPALKTTTKRVVTHPGIAPASHSLNFGVPTTPKPVSSQKASR